MSNVNAIAIAKKAAAMVAATMPDDTEYDNDRPRPETMLTEAGMSRRFVNQHGENFRYVSGIGWYVWNDTHWIEDKDDSQARQAMLGTVRRLWCEAKTHLADASIHLLREREATEAKDEDSAAKAKAAYANCIRKAEDTKKFAAGAEKSRFLNGALSIAQTERELRLQFDQLDKDAWLINCLNGTLNLQTGALQPHDRRNYLTRVIDIEYDPKADCPTFKRFLLEVFANDVEMVGYVQRLSGYALTGLCREHILPVLWGVGRNGKGTFLEMLKNVLGEYATAASSAILTDREDNAGAPTPHLMTLKGRRLAWVSETKEGERMATGIVKRLTGGDTIRARGMRKDEVSFNPTHTIFLLTNHKPHIPADDFAIWQRVKLIPFTQKFVDNPNPNDPNEHKKDPELMDKLKTERQGILAWLAYGCQRWQAMGMCEPASIKTETENYKNSEDTLGLFLTDCCIWGNKDAFSVQAGSLYKAYKMWCDENEIRPMNGNKFGTKIQERFGYTMLNGKRIYRGVGLVAEDTTN